jgi:hypothetical protein
MPMPMSMQMMMSHLGSSIKARNCQCEYVKAPLAPQKQKDIGHIPDTTNDNHQKVVFMDAKMQLSETMINPRVKCQMPLVTTQA